MASFNRVRLSFLTFGALCSCACSGVAREEATGTPAADSYAASARVAAKCAVSHEQLIDLGSLDPRPGLADSLGLAVNDQGTVVGSSSDGEGRYHAFRWQADTGMVDLNPSCEASSIAYDVNDLGEVVGSMSMDGSDGYRYRRAVLWDAGNGVHELGTFGGSSSYASTINNRGQVIGEADDEAGLPVPFIWEAKTGMTKIELPPHYGLTMAGINDSGVVVGTWFAPNGSDFDGVFAFKWTKEDGVIQLDQLPAPSGAEANGINNNGDIVGNIRYYGSSVAVKWTACDTVRLPGLPTSTDTRAQDINDQGTIVGQGRDQKTGQPTAVAWDPMQRISVLPLQATSSVAEDVNNCGDVTGFRTTDNGSEAFLWHPEPPAQ
jgi:probable HAF family extracellular repeat protein